MRVGGLLALFDRDRSREVYECRRCGTSFEEHPEECPHCEAGSIARYELG